MSVTKIYYLIIACFVGLVGCWVIGLSWFVYSIPTKIEDNITNTDAIVVLTGGQKRIVEGIRLLAANKAEKLLITGVGQRVSMEEIELLSEEFVPVNIKPLLHRITLGYMAGDTKGNAREAALWINLNNYTSLRLVTANYHMIRSYAEFKTYLPDKHIIIHPVFPGDFVLEQWWRSPVVAKLIVLEYNKFLISNLVKHFSLIMNILLV